MIWIVVNTSLVLTRPIAPYPFILLNLVLSTPAALQAPVIMILILQPVAVYDLAKETRSRWRIDLETRDP